MEVERSRAVRRALKTVSINARMQILDTENRIEEKSKREPRGQRESETARHEQTRALSIKKGLRSHVAVGPGRGMGGFSSVGAFARANHVAGSHCGSMVWRCDCRRPSNIASGCNELLPSEVTPDKK